MLTITEDCSTSLTERTTAMTPKLFDCFNAFTLRVFSKSRSWMKPLAFLKGYLGRSNKGQAWSNSNLKWLRSKIRDASTHCQAGWVQLQIGVGLRMILEDQSLRISTTGFGFQIWWGSNWATYDSYLVYHNQLYL